MPKWAKRALLTVLGIAVYFNLGVLFLNLVIFPSLPPDAPNLRPENYWLVLSLWILLLALWILQFVGLAILWFWDTIILGVLFGGWTTWLLAQPASFWLEAARVVMYSFVVLVVVVGAILLFVSLWQKSKG